MTFQYWFEHIYSLRIETTTRMLGSYTLYELILPSMETDIKLKFVTVEYLDQLLEQVSKICSSAGNKGRELLSLAFKDALFDGFINYNRFRRQSLIRGQSLRSEYSVSEAESVLQAASKNPWYLEILLGLFCGLRKGEILGLKFSDFDFEKTDRQDQPPVSGKP